MLRGGIQQRGGTEGSGAGVPGAAAAVGRASAGARAARGRWGRRPGSTRPGWDKPLLPCAGPRGWGVERQVPRTASLPPGLGMAHHAHLPVSAPQPVPAREPASLELAPRSRKVVGVTLAVLSVTCRKAGRAGAGKNTCEKILGDVGESPAELRRRAVGVGLSPARRGLPVAGRRVGAQEGQEDAGEAGSFGRSLGRTARLPRADPA